MWITVGNDCKCWKNWERKGCGKEICLSTFFHRRDRDVFFHRKSSVDIEKDVENFGENVETYWRLFYFVELMLVMMAFTVSA